MYYGGTVCGDAVRFPQFSVSPTPQAVAARVVWVRAELPYRRSGLLVFRKTQPPRVGWEAQVLMKKIFPLSYSRLSTFEQCPAKFDYLHVTKSVRDEGSEHSLYGDRVHKALEEYGKTKAAPAGAEKEVARFLPLVDTILKQNGDKLFEYQMAIRRDKSPCGWFDNDVWLRSIADVLVIDDPTAFVFDWKTGKVRENPTQLKLFAAMVMSHLPVNTVKTCYVWLQYEQVTMDTYHRADLPAIWSSLEPRLDYVQDTIEHGVFKTKPSGLCPWCPAKGVCPDARLKR